jgi:hypothetical protein
MAAWLRRLTHKRSNDNFIVDELTITCTSAEGPSTTIAWEELSYVSAAIRSSGPFGEATSLLFFNDTGSEIAMTLPEAESHGLFGRLQELPGFDKQKLAELRKGAEGVLLQPPGDRTLVLWRRP